MMKKTLLIINNIVAILIHIAAFPILIGIVILCYLCYLLIGIIKWTKSGQWWNIVLAINRFENDMITRLLNTKYD